MKSIAFTKEFYNAITHLFYSFSIIDKKMSVKEKKEIVWSIKDEWATNAYGFNKEEFIYESMRILIKNKLSAENAFETFTAFFS